MVKPLGYYEIQNPQHCIKYYKKRLQRKLKRRKYPRVILRLVGTIKRNQRPEVLHANKKRMYKDKLLPFIELHLTNITPA